MIKTGSYEIALGIMLLRFEVGNFRSIKDRMVLDLRASADSSHRETNTFSLTDEPVLRSAALYGANGSGKSNVLRGLKFLTDFAYFSATGTQQDSEIDVIPFRLCTETESGPSFFELETVRDGIKYRYGLEVSRRRVHAEWLFEARSSREAMLFTREGNEIICNPDRFREGKNLVTRTRPNASFLSVCAQFNGEVASRALATIASVIITPDARIYQNGISRTLMRLGEENFQQRALEMLAAADLTIKGLRVDSSNRQTEFLSLANPVDVYSKVIKTIHKKYTANQEPVEDVEFDLLADESAGTVRFVSLLAPFIDGLAGGHVVVADELDSRMHPLMTRFLVSLFHGPANTNGAQLIFATHDVNLLSNKYFRRDQIYFTEKDRAEATHLYSLADYRVEGDRVRKDASFAKDYLLGKFGAVPFIGDFMITQPDAKANA
ncbi:MAG: AAA family ATPase [Opitutaceae bacterium]|nr:AAA family ATPase [Opitutaceae bacterium]